MKVLIRESSLIPKLQAALHATLHVTPLPTEQLSAAHVIQLIRSDRISLARHERTFSGRDTILPVILWLHEHKVSVGPVIAPGKHWCATCIARQREEAEPVHTYKEQDFLSNSVFQQYGNWANAIAVLISQLLSSGNGQSLIYVLDQKTLAVIKGEVVLEGCAITHPPLPLILNRMVRISRHPLSDLDVESAINPFLGPVLEITPNHTARTPFPSVAARLAEGKPKRTVHGIGRAIQFQAARRVAILEVLERHAGLKNRSAASSFSYRYRDIEHDALDPRTVGLYSSSQYALPNFPCRPFDSNERHTWLEAVSLTRNTSVLVPVELIIYGELDLPAQWVLETSSGCSLGHSFEEAVTFGLFEVIERDAALAWWYRAKPIPPLDVSTRLDPETRLLWTKLELLGYTLTLLDITADLRVPTALLLATMNAEGSAVVLCATASERRLSLAIAKAVSDISSMIWYGLNLSEAEWKRAEHLAQNPKDVSTIYDHLLAVALPSAMPFITNRIDSTNVQAWFHSDYPSIQTLDDLLGLVEARGYEVIAFDQTSPTLRAHGLWCVKVIVPGLIPMHFGARLRRQVLNGRGGEGWHRTRPHPFS